ncbi:MAG: FlgO family outer membrane protein [Desulfobulbaceae bacterium]|nr:FlgO family outer membrane protein [Desulfobulbaceae bacterium]
MMLSTTKICCPLLLATSCWLLRVLFLFTMAGLAGCSTGQAPQTVSSLAPDFFGIGEELAQQLIAHRQDGSGAGERLIFTTLVNLDDLRQTSKFGRTLSESMATQLFQHGYGVVELRKTANIMLQTNNGEMILSRDASRIAKQYEANAIVAGTYSLTPKTVILNVKLLDVNSNAVLSVAGMELERSSTINYLLAEQVGLVDEHLSGLER